MNPQRILIVDDEPPIRELLQAYFQRKGYEALVASSGTEAHDYLSKNSADLVILDVILADADGMEVLQSLKQIRPQCPIVMMTGAGMDQNLLREAKTKGAAGYVSKTLPLDQLLKEVQTILALQ